MQRTATAKAVEKNSGSILFECPMDKIEEVYAFALRMEEMDIEVLIQTPGLPESLAIELGAGDADLEQLQDSIKHEIGQHPEESCCFKA
jgi:hypothetical protein